MLHRRTLLGAGACISLIPFLGGCTEADLRENMMPDGYEMPLESAPHERTFMQWPVSVDVYGRKLLGRVQASIALIANTCPPMSSCGTYRPTICGAAILGRPL
jgi:agmatine deiminase